MAKGILVCVRSTVTSRTREVTVVLCNTVRPLLKCCVEFWARHFKKDIVLLESMQRRAAKLVKGLGSKSYEEQLGELELFSLEESEVRLHCSLPKRRLWLISLLRLQIDGIRENDFWLYQGNCVWDFRRNFFREGNQALEWAVCRSGGVSITEVTKKLCGSGTRILSSVMRP